MRFALIASPEGLVFLLIGIQYDELPPCTEGPMFGQPFPHAHIMEQAGHDPRIDVILTICAKDSAGLDAGFETARQDVMRGATDDEDEGDDPRLAAALAEIQALKAQMEVDKQFNSILVGDAFEAFKAKPESNEESTDER
jgi:hypothetical protein